MINNYTQIMSAISDSPIYILDENAEPSFVFLSDDESQAITSTEVHKDKTNENAGNEVRITR